MQTKVGNLPCIPVDCTVGREITRKFDFTNDKGEHVSGEKSCLQFSFIDAEGIPSIGVAIKARELSFDFSRFIGKPARLFVTRFSTDSSGMCVFYICGVDTLD